MSDRKIIPFSTASASVMAGSGDPELELAERRETEARTRLHPADWAEVKPIILPLFDLPMEGGKDPRSIVGAIRMTVQGEPLWAIKETVAAFITGRAGKGFCPSSAELGIELRKRTDPLRETLGRAMRMADQIRKIAADAPSSEGSSPEMRAHVAAAIARMQATSASMRLPERPECDRFAAFRGAENAPVRSRPLTPEDVAHVPDAPKRGMPRIPVPTFEPFAKGPI